jgi:hypothetical protein
MDDWIHREDLLGMIDFLLAHLGAGRRLQRDRAESATSREFAQALGRVLHRPALLPAPALAFRAAFGECHGCC